MSILVDRPRWPWRGEYWSHMVSDTDLEELHRFAGSLGVRRLAFQGDHYDLPRARLAHAVEQGATIVDSRTLVQSLRASGMRHRQSMGWHRHVWWTAENETNLGEAMREWPIIPPAVQADITTLRARVQLQAVVVLRRPTEWGIGVSTDVAPDPATLSVGPRRWPTTDEGRHHLDWFVPDERGDGTVGTGSAAGTPQG